MDKKYKNLVFTDHALDRSSSRTVNRDAIWETVNHPGQKYREAGETTKFIKTVGGRKIHVVANYLKNERQWLVISVWVRGENDQLPLLWQLLTLPFKIVFWLGSWVFGTLRKSRK